MVLYNPRSFPFVLFYLCRLSTTLIIFNYAIDKLSLSSFLMHVGLQFEDGNYFDICPLFCYGLPCLTTGMIFH